MNLFRSEEHARNSAEFDPALEATMLPLAGWADIFASELFRQRRRPDYISWLHGEGGAAAYVELRAKMPAFPG